MCRRWHLASLPHGSRRRAESSPGLPGSRLDHRPRHTRYPTAKRSTVRWARWYRLNCPASPRQCRRHNQYRAPRRRPYASRMTYSRPSKTVAASSSGRPRHRSSAQHWQSLYGSAFLSLRGFPRGTSRWRPRDRCHRGQGGPPALSAELPLHSSWRLPIDRRALPSPWWCRQQPPQTLRHPGSPSPRHPRWSRPCQNSRR